MTNHKLRLLCLGAMSLALLLGCAGAGTRPESPVSASSASDYPEWAGVNPEGQDVLARVEKLEMNAHEEFLSDGDVLVAHMVTFAIYEPPGVHHVLNAYSYALPAIGDRRIQLGDLVRFEVPRGWYKADLSLDDLGNLRFRE